MLRTSSPGRGISLSTSPAPTYHNWMTPKSHVVARAILLVGIAGIMGCEDAAKKSVAHAAVPGSSIMALKQGTPATRVVGTGVTEKNTSAPPQLPPLPVFAPNRQP